MIDPTQVLRADLRAFTGYASARRMDSRGDTWLNANESPFSNASDPAGALRRYPQPQPRDLVRALADLYDVPADAVLACRGSDEAIDLLVRATCRPGADAIVIASPVFGMYAVSARLHGVRVDDVPACEDDAGFRVDLGAIERTARAGAARVVFLCSPCNPTGELLEGDAVLGLARALADQALVVVDEAYIEYADAPSLARSVESTPNLVVLRTLSKAHALAGVRVGCAIADPRIVAALARCQAPYPLPIDSTRAALDALQPAALRASRDGVVAVLRERDRVLAALAASPRVRAVHPSHANFLLVRFHDAQSAWTRLLDAGVVVRDMRGDPRLPDALRVTIGSAGDNTRMLEALS